MLTGSFTYLQSKNRGYYTDFLLYPKSLRDPIITITPVNAFRQQTWISAVISDPATNKFYAYLQNLPQLFNKVTMLEGTAFNVELPVLDPTILSNAGFDMIDDRNLEYKWLKDGSVLYNFSNINELKGTNKLLITSESCTRDISGTYEFVVTNRKTGGSTTSDPLVVDVLDLNNHPMLHKNLLLNGCGEQNMSGWITENDILSNRFTIANRTSWSIPYQVYDINYNSPYTKEFYFSLYGNENALSRTFSITMDPYTFDTGSNQNAYYNKWNISSFKPNLVATDGERNDYFYPSWDYIDTYNKNQNLYKLGDIIQRARTYITRDKIKFATYGGKPTSTARQTINLRNVEDMIDGRVYGIDNLIAHFFAYVGIGISSYKIQYIDAGTGQPVEDNMIPLSMFEYKISSLNNKPPFIPLHPDASTLTKDITTINNRVVTTYDENYRNKYAKKIKPNTKIQLTPVCYDKIDVRLDFLDGDNNTISSETVPGPTEKDIWAVKEKFFMSQHIGNLYGWCTDAYDQEFTFYSQSFTTLEAIRGNDSGSTSQIKDVNTEWIKKYRYKLIESGYDFTLPSDYVKTVKQQLLMPSATEWDREQNTNWLQDVVNNYGFNKSFLEINNLQQLTLPIFMTSNGNMDLKYDSGAAAFFAIQRDFEIPRGTKAVTMTVIFNHTSETIHDENPKQKLWNKQTIYYDVFSKESTSEQLVEYGNPRSGITAVHLSLHPNNVQVSEKYNTYEVNLSGSVWSQELTRLENQQEYWSVQPQSYNIDNLQYKYSVSTIPIQTLNTSNLPLNTTLLELLYPGAILVQTTPPVPQQPTPPTASVDTGSRATETTPTITQNIDTSLQVTSSIVTASLSTL